MSQLLDLSSDDVSNILSVFRSVESLITAVFPVTFRHELVVLVFVWGGLVV